jgi:catechol 2,3-dioxygenase-like lactoylglutathione lyase family enzyme
VTLAGAAPIEVITLPVADVDRSRRFHVETLGFTLDVGYALAATFRVVQVTPPGSACSIQFGQGVTDANPGTSRTSHLVVRDLEQVHGRLAATGVAISAVRHKTPTAHRTAGSNPGSIRTVATTPASPTSPPGRNTWMLQERGDRRA